jgi:ABC-2 type transport system permease protein
MGKTWVVFKREYLERVRSKWFIIATLLGPALMAVITILPAVMAAKTRVSSEVSNVIVIDATGTDFGARVAKTLATPANPITASPTAPALPAANLPATNAPVPQLRTVKPEALAAADSAATNDVRARRAVGYLILDSLTLAGKELRYAGRNATSIVDVESISRSVRQTLLAMRLEKEGIDPKRVNALTSFRIDTKTEKISDKGKEGAGGIASLIFGYIIAFALYMMIAIYGQSIMRGVLEEKTTRVAEVVISSVKPDALLTGKILGSGLVALTQVMVWIIVAYVMYVFVRAPILAAMGAPVTLGAAMKIPGIAPLDGVALFLFFVLGFTFYAALFGAVGAMVSNQEDIQQAAMPVMLMLVSAIIFMQPILLAPSSKIAIIMSMLPFSAPMMMPMRMALVAVPWYEKVGALASVVVGCAIAIWLSARIYRVGLLMYGKRPSLKELTRWIRMA